MQIDKSSWHYKVYRWTYSLWDHYPPVQTNLCQYINRLLWMPLLNCLAIAVGGAAGITGLLIATPIAMILGWRLTNPFSKEVHPDAFVRYSGLK